MSAITVMTTVTLLGKFINGGVSIAKMMESLKKNGKELGEAATGLLNTIQECIAKHPEKKEEVLSQDTFSQEILDRIQAQCREVMFEYAQPVYIDGVNLICSRPLGKEEKETVEAVLTDEGDDCTEEDEREKQEIIDEFKSYYLGGEIDMDDNCDIESDMISFNFNFTAGEEYLYCEEDIRKLADALNYFLGETIITGYTPFNSELLERAGLI